MDRKDKLFVVNEVRLQLKLSYYKQKLITVFCLQVCEIKNCNKCIFFEAKKKQDLYMWLVFDSSFTQSPQFISFYLKKV